LADDDLIVHVNDHVYRARGRASFGESVRLQGQKGRVVSMVSAGGDFQEMPAFLCRYGFGLRSIIERRIERFPETVRSWLRGFILGDQDAIDVATWADFRSLGLLHMLVLSGSHVSIIGVFMAFALRLPWWIFYVLGRLNILTWIKVSMFSNICSAVVLLLYCVAAGLTQSLQRAFFCFIVATIFPLVGVFKRKFSRVLTALCIQALICPTNFLSLGLIMSWTGVLVLVAFTESNYLKPLWRLIIDVFLIQSVFFIISLIFFGRIGVLALPANMIFHAIFSVLLPFDVFALLVPTSVLDHWLVMLNLGCLSMIDKLSKFQASLAVREIFVPALVTFSKPDGRMVIVFVIVGLCIAARIRELGARDT
jgi:predicted membrane metal-binding protein